MKSFESCNELIIMITMITNFWVILVETQMNKCMKEYMMKIGYANSALQPIKGKGLEEW